MSKTLTLQAVEENPQEVASEISNGAIAILPTDTIYGIVGSAKLGKTVEKIYRLRKRASSKPMIVLVDSVEQIIDLGLKITLAQKSLLKKIWPNKVSVVLPCRIKKLQYLHRGKNSIAFRIPNNEFLLSFLGLTGPIVAPSANFEGEEPAKNIFQAKKYFKDSIAFYIDAGEMDSKPSTVLSLEKNKLKVLREGAYKLPKKL